MKVSMAARELLRGLLFLALINGVCISKIKSAIYKYDGRICYMCSKGHRVVEHCTVSGTQSNCGLCPNGTYNPEVTKAKECIWCRMACGQDEDEVSPCNTTSDRQCACKRGLGKKAIDDTLYGYTCLNCSSIGEILWEGEKTGITVRECRKPCLAGHFLNNSSECIPCTNCTAKGLVTKANCTTTENAQCIKEESKKPVNLTLLWIFGALVAAIVIAVVAAVWYCRKQRKVSYELSLWPDNQIINVDEDEYERF